jgi:signal transduction histidine kinase
MRLSAILDADSLSVIEAGCSVRLGCALTIIDYDQPTETFQRIDPVNHVASFRDFCQTLRNPQRVAGGNEACEHCDIQRVRSVISSGSTPAQTQEYRCHMGLLDMARVVHVHGQPIAVLLTGQFRPPEGISEIERSIEAIRLGKRQQVVFLDDGVADELHRCANGLPDPSADFVSRLDREASLVTRLAEAEHDRLKAHREQGFLDKLRAMDRFSAIDEVGDLQEFAASLLRQIQEYCGAEYVLFFANIRQNDTVLAPLAQSGLPARLVSQLPHFNWKKATLPMAGSRIPSTIDDPTWFSKGVRGSNSDLLSAAACAFPVALGSLYRGVLVFGSFARPVDLKREHRFLREIGRIVGWFILTELEILHLQAQQKQKESMMKLLTHQVRTAITPITTQVGGAKMLLDRPLSDASLRLLQNYLNSAKRLALHLGSSVAETVNSHTLLIEKEDLKFEPYPLSVLVGNCIEAFAPEADRRQRTLTMDESVETLPIAEVDIARLTIAVSNLIDNALKYSYPTTRIIVRAKIDPAVSLDEASATIEVSDLGDAIPDDQRERIFEQGHRALIEAKLRRIPGTGIGLWEAKAVVDGHGGRILARSEPTNRLFRQGRAHLVTLSLTIPLRQPSLHRKETT